MWKIHIKRIIAIIFSLGSLYALCGVVTAFVSMFKEVERLSNDPTANGMDFLLLEPLFIVFFSIVGLICSGVSTKLCTYKATKIIAFVLLLIFSIIMFVAFSMWVMG